MVLNPNNWHWIEKNTLPWSKEYLETAFVNFETPLTGSDEFTHVYVHSIEAITGDSHVSQRKGKVICYFDLHLKFKLALRPKAEEGNEIEEIFGSLSIPEFMHDESDFLIKIEGFDPAKESLVKKDFQSIFLEKLLKYQSDLISQHSKDVQE